MSDDTLNNTVNQYVSNHFSPKPEQRAYITGKYDELKRFLSGSCFQTGSYARFTAVDPVHDLDVIYTTTDTKVVDNPRTVLEQLMVLLKSKYAESETKVIKIHPQTHSITIELGDSPEGKFSIDVVPAVELTEKNDFGDPIYMVPEIIKLNHHNRQERYSRATTLNPIGWIKSDPRGYVSAASALNDKNANFRHAVKLLKSWRHANKVCYGDEFKLKSFHLEQIVGMYFIENPNASTADAAVGSLEDLPNYMQASQIPDRADKQKHIDEYVDNLSPTEKSLILRLQTTALGIAYKLSSAASIDEVQELLANLVIVPKKPIVPSGSARSRPVAPRQPWSI